MSVPSRRALDYSLGAAGPNRVAPLCRPALVAVSAVGHQSQEGASACVCAALASMDHAAVCIVAEGRQMGARVVHAVRAVCSGALAFTARWRPCLYRHCNAFYT